MDKFKISNYLTSYNKENHRGKCKSCDREIQWSCRSVASHKRVNCSNATAEEKNFFAKKPRLDVDQRESNSSFDETNSSLNEIASKEEIDSAFANLFYRTGISCAVFDKDDSFVIFRAKERAGLGKIAFSMTIEIFLCLSIAI